MLICIDAGHYMGTPGKRCMKSIDPNETREWFLNGRVADKVQKGLSIYDCQTMRVDDPTGQNEITMYERTTAANRAKSDVYLSIHHNAGIRGGSGGGITVYVRPGADEQSKQLQRAIYQHSIAATGLVGNRAAPMAEGNFYVLRATTMPAVLGEFGFMDSTRDTPVILTEEYANQLAAGIVAALVEVYDLKEVEDVSYERWKAHMERYRDECAQQPPSSWAKEKLEEAVQAGVTDGTRPGDLITRQEAAIMALAAMKQEQ